MKLAACILLAVATFLVFPAPAPAQLSRPKPAVLTFERRTTGEPATISVIQYPSFGISSDNIALTGTIANNSTSTVKLTMWVTFADGNRYFSYLIFPPGPAKPFELPMRSPGMVAVAAELWADFAGTGSITLDSQSLTSYPPSDQLIEKNAWWTQRSAGMIGGLAGSALGLIGAAVGLLSRRNRHLRLARLISLIITVLGIPIFLLGLFADFHAQPWFVYRPLLLIGFLSTIIFFITYRRISHDRQSAELRQMRALDT